MIQFVKCPVCSDGNSFQTLELAQSHEIELILKEDAHITVEDRPHVATVLIANAAKIVDILTTKKTSLSKARRVNGGTKPRKPKENMSERQEQDRIDAAKKKKTTEATV